jgi:hypothetical protein
MVFSSSRTGHPDPYGSADLPVFHASPELAAIEPALDPHFGYGRRKRRSILGQAFRALFYGLLIAAVAGLPLAWQLGDKDTKDMIAAWATELNKWIGVSTAKPPSAGMQAAPKVPDRAAAATPAMPAQQQAAGGAALAPVFAPVAAGSAQELERQPPERQVQERQAPERQAPQYQGLQHQLETIAGDLASVRRLVEQLAARQSQMAQDLATLQAAERDVSQKLSSLSQPPAHPPPRKPAPKPLPLAAPPQSSAAPLPPAAARPQEPPPSQ